MNNKPNNSRFAIRIANIMLCMILSITMYVASIAPAMLVFAVDENPDQNQAAAQADADMSDDDSLPADEEATDEDIDEDPSDSDQQDGMSLQLSESPDEDAEEAGDEEEEEAEEVIEDPAAYIGKKAYASLKEAVLAAKDGDEIVLQKDVQDKVAVEGKKISIDLDGHIWNAKGGSYKQFARLNASAELTIKNGTLKGGKSKYGEEAALYNDGGKLTLSSITLTKGLGEQIRNLEGTLVIDDSKFMGNSTMESEYSRYIVYNKGGSAKATIKNSKFTNNNMKGGILYSGGSSYSSSKNELNLISCDIKNNTINRSSIYCESCVHLNMNDTTVSGNESTNNQSGYPAGLAFKRGWIQMKNSAVYNNTAPSNIYDKDIYVYPEDIMGGEIPLPSDMSDHGRSLESFELCDNRYSIVMTEPVTSDTNSKYREYTLEHKAGSDVIAEYNGEQFASVAEAVKAMNGKGGTIRILKNVSINETIQAHDGIVIDLDTHTISAKSTSRPVFTIEGGEVSVKNGCIKDGMANTGSAISTQGTILTLEGLKVENCKSSAVYSRFNNSDSVSKCKVNVTDCEFVGNGSNEENYAVNIADCDLTINNCKFDGNTGAVRAYESEGSSYTLAVKDSDFVNGTDQQIDLYMYEGSKSFFTNCNFKNNTLKNSRAVIRSESRSYGTPDAGAAHTFSNCVFTGNSGASVGTIYAEYGNFNFNNCEISGNSGKSAGAIYADSTSSLTMKDSVVKNNKATRPSSNTAGGIVLYSAEHVLVSPVINGSGGGSTNIGFYAASLDMEGGAIYGNENGGSSPSAEDILVKKGCPLKVPEVSEMEDGGNSFIGLFWKDDAKNDVEKLPAENDQNARYYSVGVPGGIKQVYVDGVNGDDSNIGTKESPVKTLEFAAELAKTYKCKNILVLGTVTISAGEEDADTPSRGLSRSALKKSSDDSSKPKTLDFEGIAVKRDKGFVGLVMLVKEGTDLTLKNVTVEGESGTWVKAKDSLIRVEKGAKLTLDEGVSLQNNGYNRNYGIEKGGAVHCLGELVMNDGATIYHNYAVTGGGICVDGGTFTMNGGLIDDNVALFRLYSGNNGGDYLDSYGGGVCLINGAYMEMLDGTISNNEALHAGGGVSLGTEKTNTVTKGTNTFVMRGGSIDSNKGYAGGGGIYVQCNTEAYIAAGNITNNIAQYDKYNENLHAGGGIYVNGFHNSMQNALGIAQGKLYLTNVEIANNTADWSGGAIAVCGTGSGNLNEIKGTVIHDNDAKAKGPKSHGYDGDYDVFFDNIRYIYDYYNGTGWTTVVNEELDYESYVSEYMLNGGEYNWTDEEGDLISTETLHKVNKRFLANTEVTADDPDVIASVKKATVHINNNSSQTNGGGIGCNGELYIGQLPDHIDINVVKDWNDEEYENERPDSIKVQLFRDGELYDTKEIRADEDGNWIATFQDLPEYHMTPNGEQTKVKYEYEIREDMTFKPAGSDKAIGEVYRDYVVDNGDGNWTVVNTYMRVLGDYEEEEEGKKTKGEYKEEGKRAEKSKSAKTGDDTMVMLWAVLLIVSLTVLTATAIKRRRSNNVH